MDERLGQLVDELISNAGYVDGRRRFPRTFTMADGLTVTRFLHDELDRACDARGRAAAAAGKRMACAAGCNHCCEQAVVASLPEAQLIAEWLGRPENAEARRRFLAAFPSWRERTGDDFERIAAAKGEAALVAAHVAHWKKKVMCAFNHEGLCTIYAVRPALCRTGHALETNERCKAENYDGTLPLAFSHAPLERYVKHQRNVDHAMHHALGGERGKKKALCQAVADLLGD